MHTAQRRMPLLSVLAACLLQACVVSSALNAHELLTASRTAQMMEEQQTASPSYTNDWAVEVEGSSEAADLLAGTFGFINMGQIGSLEGFYHFQFNVSSSHGNEMHQHRNVSHIASRSIGSFAEMARSPDLSAVLQQHGNVRWVEQQKLIKRVKKDYTAPTDPNWSHQWSLLNTGSITRGPAGNDLNVEPAWMQGITGSGVVVGIVDNGLERRHSDLSANYDPHASYDFVHHDSDPTPDNYYGDDPDSHGTECAGVIGMAKSNGHCGVGVAYHAHIGGVKLDLSRTDLTEASALSYKYSYIKVYSNSWGPSDSGFDVDGPGTLAKRALANGVTQGRQGKGSIYVLAAGNGGLNHDSCAADGYSSSIHTISVGSANYNGYQADYDEECPAKMAVTFSYNSNTFPGPDSTWDTYNQLSTTTLSGRCTDDFTGTSASAPLLSGTMALVLEANPALTWRDVQYLIAYTSTQDKLHGGSWTTNGGGLKVHPKFGFGAIDAEAMVTRARRWTNVPTQHSSTINLLSSDGTVRQNSAIITTFRVTSSNANSISFLEHVVVSMSLSLFSYGTGYDYDDFDYEMQYGHGDIYAWLASSHPKRGDIKIDLTSPQGTTSTLLPYRLYDFVNEDGYSNWPFMSVHHWGENPVGTWTLRVSFKSNSGYVSMSGLRMDLYGTTITPPAVAYIPTHCDSACRGRCSGTGPQNCDVCHQKRVAKTLECVSSCPAGTYAYKNYCLAPSDGSNNNVIVGSAVGGVALVLVIVLAAAAVAIFVYRKRKSPRMWNFVPLKSNEPAEV